MIKYHLNEAQRKFLRGWLDYHTARPDFATYDRDSRTISKIEVDRKPAIKAISHTRPGFESNQLVPLPEFDATKHLPPGWAICSDFDSGGNHRLHNAGEAMLTTLWNAWSSVGPAEPLLNRLPKMAGGLDLQLRANLIVSKA